MILLLDITVFITGVAGAILLIKKNKLGFISFLVHSFIWGGLSIGAGHYGAALTCLIFICIDSWGYYEWSKAEKPKIPTAEKPNIG